MFLHLSVSHSVWGVVSASVHAGIHTRQKQTPPGSRHPQEADTSWEADTPLHSACWEIWATSGQYTSYWDAYLFILERSLDQSTDFVYVTTATSDCLKVQEISC